MLGGSDIYDVRHYYEYNELPCYIDKNSWDRGGMNYTIRTTKGGGKLQNVINRLGINIFEKDEDDIINEVVVALAAERNMDWYWCYPYDNFDVDDDREAYLNWDKFPSRLIYEPYQSLDNLFKMKQGQISVINNQDKTKQVYLLADSERLKSIVHMVCSFIETEPWLVIPDELPD